MKAIFKNKVLSVLFFLAIVILSGCGASKSTKSMNNILSNCGVLRDVEELYNEGWRVYTTEVEKELGVPIRSGFLNDLEAAEYYTSLCTNKWSGRNNKTVMFRTTLNSNGNRVIMYKIEELPERIYNNDINNINLDNEKEITEKEEEQKDLDFAIINGIKYDGIIINDIMWATRNVGDSGTFVSSPLDKGNFYTWEKAQSACPQGWRLPTDTEFESLFSNLYSLTAAYNKEDKKGYLIDDALFLPQADVYKKEEIRIGVGYWTSSIVKQRHIILVNNSADSFLGTADVDDNVIKGLYVRCVHK